MTIFGTPNKIQGCFNDLSQAGLPVVKPASWTSGSPQKTRTLNLYWYGTINIPVYVYTYVEPAVVCMRLAVFLWLSGFLPQPNAQHQNNLVSPRGLPAQPCPGRWPPPAHRSTSSWCSWRRLWRPVGHSNFKQLKGGKEALSNCGLFNGG